MPSFPASFPNWMTRVGEEVQRRAIPGDLTQRFGPELRLGTGGMRGPTVAQWPVPEEVRGGTPVRPAVGPAFLNEVCVARATVGLWNYLSPFFIPRVPAKALGADFYTPARGANWPDSRQEGAPAQEGFGEPEARPGLAEPLRLVVAYDTRYFSRGFSQLVARVWCRLGGQVCWYPQPRSTPQLSFSIRHLRCHAGVMITASHNPPQDNGYKVYLADGAQVVPPHAEGLMAAMQGVSLESIAADLGEWDAVCGPEGYLSTEGWLGERPPGLEVLGEAADAAYQQAVEAVAGLWPEKIRAARPRVVYTPLHGVGAASVVPVLQRAGVQVDCVEAQCVPDPRFATVRSPNPEDPEAFRLGLQQAPATEAWAVLATDPDADRLGVYARDAVGEYQRLTGNQLACVLAHYRIGQMQAAGLLPDPSRGVILKSFVTTPLLERIAAGAGIPCVNTLTGFKWIGRKLLAYEVAAQQALGLQVGENRLAPCTAEWPADYRARVAAYQAVGRVFVWGAEESYGYLCGEAARDKDATAAALLFCELLAHLAQQGRTVPEYLADLWRQYGYAQEGLLNLAYPGVEGAARIARILKALQTSPPQQLGGLRVTAVQDFLQGHLRDAQGEAVPTEPFFIFQLEGGSRVAVRASGTEPKLKAYLFVEEAVGKESPLELAQKAAQQRLGHLQTAVQAYLEAL